MDFRAAMLQVNSKLGSFTDAAEWNRMAAAAAIVLKRVSEANNDLVFENTYVDLNGIGMLAVKDLRMELQRLHGPATASLTRVPVS